MTTMTFYKKLSTFLLGACVFSALVSCGNNIATGGGEAGKGSGSQQNQNNQPTPSPVVEELGLIGNYSVEFKILNGTFSGLPFVEGYFELMGDSFFSSIKVSNAKEHVAHYQYIYEGTECPSVGKHDTNGDGWIDPIEASKVLGKILIPLDGDLNSQFGGIDYSKSTDYAGVYDYGVEGSLSRLESDLMALDPNPNDVIAKLAPGEKLKLEGKVVVITGITLDSYPPGSIQIFEGTSVYKTLPVACGKIVRNMLPESPTGAQ